MSKPQQIIRFTIYALFIAFLSSCSASRSESVYYKSDDERVVIEVFGERSVIGDPWETTVRVTIDDQLVYEASAQVYASDISSKNVEFAWTAKNKCTVMIKQRDDTTVNISIPPINDGSN